MYSLTFFKPNITIENAARAVCSLRKKLIYYKSPVSVYRNITKGTEKSKKSTKLIAPWKNAARLHEHRMRSFRDRSKNTAMYGQLVLYLFFICLYFYYFFFACVLKDASRKHNASLRCSSVSQQKHSSKQYLVVRFARKT